MGKILAALAVLKEFIDLFKKAWAAYQDWRIKRKHKKLQKTKDEIAKAIAKKDGRSISRNLHDL